MKKIILSLVFLVGLGTTYSQDILVKKNAEEVKVKVLEINSNNIKYKSFNNLEGPTYTINKNEVFFIKYKNGQKDVFTTTNNTNDNFKPAGFLSIEGRKFLLDNKKIPKNEFINILKTDKVAYNKYLRAKRGSKIGFPIVILSGLAVGAITYSAFDGGSGAGSTADTKQLTKIGGGLIGAGLTTLIGGFILNSVQNKKLNKALDTYNNHLLKNNISYNIKIDGNGIGVAVSF